VIPLVALEPSYLPIRSVDRIGEIGYRRDHCSALANPDRPIMNPLVASTPTVWVHQKK
jgi:hypothetical protein